MKLWILAAAAILAATSASLATPAEGMWPPEARGVVQPRPKWLMVIPAVRDASGNLFTWKKDDAWLRKWIVPKTIGNGIRAVTITGDADDMRAVTGPQFDSMDSSALRRLTSKYGAPALAVVVEGEDGDAAVAAWTPGRAASWDTTRRGEDSKEGAMRILGDLFSGTTPHRNRIRITGVRTVGGVDQFRIESRDWDAIQELRRNRGLEVLEMSNDGGQSIAIVKNVSGRDIEDVIADGADKAAISHHAPEETMADDGSP